MDDKLKELEQKIGYTFRDPDLLKNSHDAQFLHQ